MSDRFRPAWLRAAVLAAVAVGVGLAVWLFGVLSAPA